MTRRGVAPKGSADCGCGCKDGSCAPPKSPAPSAPARPPAHPAAPDLPLPYEIDRDGRRPVPPGFMEAPGSPQALTRFDIAEEMRRRGFPLARPQGWDGRVVPRALQYADALRPSDGSEGARQRPPPEDLPLTPDFFDELQRRNTARLGDHEILTPNRGGRDRKRAGSLTQVPWGEKFQCEPYEPPAFPIGAVVDCQELALWWSSQPATAIEPPQVQPDSEPLPLDATARADVLVRIRADRARPPAPAAPPQEDAQAPDALEHRGPEPPAPAPPGESCTAAPDWTSPPSAPGAPSMGGPLQQPKGKGGGEEEDEPEPGPIRLLPDYVDPCPCTCICIPFGWWFPVFAPFAGLVFGLQHLLRPDRSFYGVPDDWQPQPVVGPPDGWVEQLIQESRIVARELYDTPGNTAPGAFARSDGVGPETTVFRARPSSRPQLLAAGLSQMGEPALRSALPVPVGPGPGIPGFGAEPLLPADGSRIEAAPGSLFSGLAPATRMAAFESGRGRDAGGDGPGPGGAGRRLP